MDDPSIDMDPLVLPTAEDHSTLKTLIPLAVPAVKTAIDEWLVPSIKKMFKSRELVKNSKPDEVAKSFEDYLLRSYAKLSFMNTIVFGNQQKRIQDLYIPLSVVSSGNETTTFLMDGWRDDFVPKIKRVVITDTAGMGKSTVLKWLFLCSVGTSKGIPVFIELRTLSSEKPILDKIYDDLCPIDKPFDKDLLLHLLKAGRFIFFLDGYDEIAFEDRTKVTEDIQTFIKQVYNNQFVLASRHESALSSFGDFREFTIKPLAKQEAYTLLRKYDASQEHAEALIAELDHSKYEQLKDMLTNPMLVSLLFKAYSYKPKVPFKKQIFYRQVYDALFDMHDSTKGGAFVREKHSKLDIDEFHLVMRDLGFSTAKIGKIEYEKDFISDLIKKVRERNKTILFQPSALLKDLITTVPLFNKEGEQFKWAHKSVQDYFASQFIALDTKGNEKAVLEKIYIGGHCGRFENILDFLHDTDNAGFRKVLLAYLLRDYVHHYDSKYMHNYAGVTEDAVEERKQLTFGHEFAFTICTAKQEQNIFGGLNSALEKLFGKDFVPPPGTASEVGFYSFLSEPHNRVVGGVVPTSPNGLLRLLARKKYPYITKTGSVAHMHLDVPYSLPCMLTDDPKSPFNAPKTFEDVNKILRFYGYSISIEQVRRTLASIENEPEESEQVNQLLQNL